MPGAMNTFLNIGMNDELTEALGQQPRFQWTAWDCYRRLVQSWGMAFGINRDVFDQIILDFKEKCLLIKDSIYTKTNERHRICLQNALEEHNVYLEQDLTNKYA